MYIDTPEKADINDATVDLGTALTIARACIMLYFKDKSRATKLFIVNSIDNIHLILGAIINYIRSAKSILDSFKN